VEWVDQMNRTINVSETPTRIISTVPSQTEFLADLGLDDHVIGITKFCVNPDTWFRSKNRIGGTKTLDLEKIKALKPDLIIANKEENVQNQIEALEEVCPVWISDIKTLDDALSMMQSVGKLVGVSEKSNSICDGILTVRTKSWKTAGGRTAAYVIWNSPMMVAGGDTFINTMLQEAGFKNAFAHLNRYPEVDAEMMNDVKPDFILLSSEPFPFDDKHVAEFEKIFSRSNTIRVDGTMFSWYGSRLQLAFPYFEELRAEL